jgi:hypothetical protein
MSRTRTKDTQKKERERRPAERKEKEKKVQSQENNIPEYLKLREPAGSSSTEDISLYFRQRDALILAEVINEINAVGESHERLSGENLRDYLLIIADLIKLIYRKDKDGASIRNKYGIFNQSSTKENKNGIDFDNIERLADILSNNEISKEDVLTLIKVERSAILEHLIKLRNQSIRAIEAESLQPNKKSQNHKLLSDNTYIVQEKLSQIDKSSKNLKLSDSDILYKISNFFNTKQCLQFISLVINDENIQNSLGDIRDVNNRYAFARLMTIMGEVFKLIPKYQGDGLGDLNGIFKTIAKIRNGFAHGHYKYIGNPNEETLKALEKVGLEEIFNGINNILLDMNKNISSHHTDKVQFTPEMQAEINRISDLVDNLKKIFPKKKKQKAPAKQQNKKPTDEPSITDLLNIIKKILPIYEAGIKNPENKKKALIKLIKEYNSNSQVQNLENIQFPDPNVELPTTKSLAEIIERVKEVGLLEERIKKITPEKPEEKSESPEDKSTKEKEKLDKTVKIILDLKREIEYLKNAQNTQANPYAIEYCMTAIGQLCRDLEDINPELIVETTPKEFKESSKVNISTRNKLMHQILSKTHKPLLDVIYRETLPMLPEIEAISTIVDLLFQNQQEQNSDFFLKLGMSYLALKQFDKANECWKKLSAAPDADIIIDLTGNENNQEKLTTQAHIDLFNSLTLMGSTKAKEAYEALSNGNSELAKKLYFERIDIYKQYLYAAEYLLGEDLENPKIMPRQIASTYNNMANSLSHVSEYEGALETYKMAFAIISKQENPSQKSKALYLMNVGIAHLSHINESIVANTQVTDIDGTNAHLAVAYLWESKILSGAQSASKNSPEYIKMLSYLVFGLRVNGSDLNILYAQELYKELTEIVKTAPLRADDQAMIAFKITGGSVDGLQFRSISSLQNDYTNHRELVDSQFELTRLGYLAVAYADLGIDENLDERIAKAQEIIKSHEDKVSLSRMGNFGKDCEILMNLASQKFRNGNYKEAIKGYLNTLSVLDKYYQDFYPQVAANLFECLADTYLKLGNKKLALDNFNKSFETNIKYEPNDRAFQLCTKIAELNKELYTQDFPKKNYDLAKYHLKELSNIVPFDDKRLNNIKRIIVGSNVILGKNKEAFLLHKSLLDENHSADKQFYEIIAGNLSDSDIAQLNLVQKYTIPFVVGKRKLFFEKAMEENNLQVEIEQQRESDWSMTYKVYLPSDFLTKEIRDGLGLDRVAIREITGEQKKFLQENIPSIVIEDYIKNPEKPTLLTFPKSDHYREIIAIVADEKKWSMNSNNQIEENKKGHSII